MAEDDQRDGQFVTPDVSTTTPAGAADTSEEMVEARAAGGSESRRRPVRSAPIRRGRGGSKKAGKPVADSAPRAETSAAAAADEDDRAENSTSEVTGAEVAQAGTGREEAASMVSLDKPAAGTDPVSHDFAEEAAPDPSEVERTISYRERRRARLAATGPESSGVRYKGSGRTSARTVVGVVLSIVIIAVCAVASIVFALGIAHQDEVDDLRAEYSTFASQVLLNLTSMNPDTVDQTLESVQKDTSGKVKEEVQNNISQVASLVRDGKLETKTIILSSAVTKAEPDEGSVIMVFGWHQRSLDGQIPSQEKVFRWRVDMTRINGELKMTDFEWVA